MFPSCCFRTFLKDRLRFRFIALTFTHTHKKNPFKILKTSFLLFAREEGIKVTWALSAVCVRGQREEHEKGVSLVLSFSVFSAPPPSMTSVSTPKKILLQAFVLFCF